MPSERNRQVVAGLAMIVLGLALYMLMHSEATWGPAALLVLMGGAFLGAYFYFSSHGLLIPGCILLGLGLGVFWEDSLLDVGNSVQIGLGAGFLAVYLISLLYEGRSQWWPLIPGGFLVLTGLPHSERVFRWAADNWPLVFVVIGIVILIGAFRGGARPRRNGGS